MFSEAVDELVAQARRPDQKVNVTQYMNTTLRECDVFQGSFFNRDLLEAVITTTADPHIWPKPTRFRSMRAVFYVESEEFPLYIQPGKKQVDQYGNLLDYFFYIVGTDFVFRGATSPASINVAYYVYTRTLKYYEVADRPAVYDRELETWSYHATYDTNDTQRALAETLVGHWLLEDWPELLKEGARARLFKNLPDKEKTNPTFASYKSMQKDLINGEGFTLLNAAQQAGGSF